MIIGLDVGGTNIDAVLIADKKIIKVIKRPVLDLKTSVLIVIKELLKDIDKNRIKTINLSTTISTNLIVTNNLERVITIIQNGLGLPNDHYKINEDTFFIKGYIDHRGKILSNYESRELKEISEYIKKEGVDNIAINTKFSVKNNSVENKIKDYFNKDLTITTGSEITANLNFKRRINTSYLNSAIMKPFNTFYSHVVDGFNEFGLNNNINILKADGGLTSLELIKKRPVESIASGPAASLLGHLALFSLDHNKTYLNLDIGGTTTDLFLSIGDNYLFEEKGLEINNYKTSIRSIFFRSLPIGGDTAVIFTDKDFFFSNKKIDKPLALGGNYLTLTDCLNIVDEVAFGDKNLSLEGIKVFSNKLGITSEKLAIEIINIFVDEVNNYLIKELKIINSKVVYTVKEVILNKKIEVDEINIIGGPAKSLRKYFSDRLKCQVNYPKEYLYANALGAALACDSKLLSLYADTEIGYYQISELNIKEKISKDYNINDAKIILKEILGENIEYILEQEFNMVDGFYTKGKIIKVVAQLKPKIKYKVGDFNE